MGVKEWIAKRRAKKKEKNGTAQTKTSTPTQLAGPTPKGQSESWRSVPSSPKTSQSTSSSSSSSGQLAGPTPKGQSESWRDIPTTQTKIPTQTQLAGPTPKGQSESWRDIPTTNITASNVAAAQIRDIDIRKKYSEPVGTQIIQQDKTPELKIAKPGEIRIEQTEVGRTESGVPIIQTVKITDRGEATLLSKQELEELQPKTVEAIQKKAGLERLEQLTIQAGERAESKAMREKEGIKPFVAGATAFGAGAATSLVGTGIFFKEVITKPVQTAKAIPKSIASSIRGAKTIGEQLRVSPSFTLGKVAGDIALEGVSGARALKSIKAGTKIKELGKVSPTVKVSTKFKEVSKKIDIERFEPEFKKQIEKGRITETREFNVDIPSPEGNKVKMEVVEYLKDGKSKFAGVITENGKVKETISGVSDIGKSGAFTKVLQAELSKRGFKRLEVKEFIDVVKERTENVRPGRVGEMVKADVSLLRKVVEKPKKFKPIKESRLRELKEIEFGGFRKRKEPFTETELAQAKKVGESTILTEKQMKIVKKTKQEIDIMGDIASKEKAVSVKITPEEVRIAKQIPKEKSMIMTTGKITKETITRKGIREGIATFTKTAKEPIERAKIIDIGGLNGKPIKTTKKQLSKAIKKIEKRFDTKTPQGKYKMELAKKLDAELKQIKEKPIGAMQYIAEEVKIKGLKKAKRKALISGTGFGVAALSKVEVGVKDKTAVNQITKQTQVNLLKPAKQPTLKTSSDVVKAQAVETAQLLASKLSSIQKQRLKNELLGQSRVSRPITKPTVKVRAVAKVVEEKKARIKKALEKIQSKGQSVDIITGVTGKKKETVHKKNLPPKKAFMEAQKLVDKNIEASFRLRTNKKKPKEKDIKKIKVSNKFTSSKTDPLYLKEKTKYRLDSPSEKRQIKKARKKSKKKK